MLYCCALARGEPVQCLTLKNRLVHDADSHLMEMSDCLNPYFEQSLLQRFLAHPNLGVRVGNRLAIEDAQKRQQA